MKIPREAMTPALDAAIAAFVGDGVWYMLRTPGVGPTKPDPARKLLMKDHARKGCAAFPWVFAGAAIVVGIVFRLIENDDRAWNAKVASDPNMSGLGRTVGHVSLWIFALAATLFLVSLALTAWRRRLRPDGLTPSADFLAACVDRLDLLPVQRRYASALATVYGGRARDSGGEMLALLRRLTEEEARLQALSEGFASAPLSEVTEEVSGLRARLQTVRDPSAREALGQSLALAEKRLVSAERAAAVRERLEAHASLLDQASRAAAEAISGSVELRTDSDHSSLGSLRANVASLGQEAAALEAAVREMQTL